MNEVRKLEKQLILGTISGIVIVSKIGNILREVIEDDDKAWDTSKKIIDLFEKEVEETLNKLS